MRRVAAVVVIMALAACGDDPASRNAPLVASIVDDTARAELAPGEMLVLDGITLRFAQVEADSRCPTDVVCVWEGNARVRLVSGGGDGTGHGGETLLLNTALEPTRVEHGGWILWIDALTPRPHSRRATDPDDYRLLLVMTRS